MQIYQRRWMFTPSGSMLAMPSPRIQQILQETMTGSLHITTCQQEMVDGVLERSSIDTWLQLSRERTMIKEITNRSNGKAWGMLREQHQLHEILFHIMRTEGFCDGADIWSSYDTSTNLPKSFSEIGNLSQFPEPCFQKLCFIPEGS